MERNIKLTIAYKGTDYAGWQRQPNAITVESVLSEALLSIMKKKTVLYGAGRTDAGVHALGQCANFYTQSQIPTHKIPVALNTKLPASIRVLRAEEMPEDFHSRYNAVGKIYLYQMDLGEIASPFYSEYSWHMRYRLDIKAMQEAAGYFIGEHDFKGFMASGSSVKDTVRRIDAIDFKQQDERLQIFYRGNGFLYNMVRILTGTLVEVGMGKHHPDDVADILVSKERSQAGITAPPQGLFLKEVLY